MIDIIINSAAIIYIVMVLFAIAGLDTNAPPEEQLAGIIVSIFWPIAVVVVIYEELS